ncbi:hypothetical protein FACS1894208_08670 [Clostridia bacterium]|nr:hypothetical protein FACS1894208_08670 [Clostridia bacterium]
MSDISLDALKAQNCTYAVVLQGKDALGPLCGPESSSEDIGAYRPMMRLI